MKRVLIVCYYFPPLGLGGVGRPLNLYRFLPDFGWESHILTVKPVAYRAYEPELLDGLDLSRVHRSGSRDPQRLLYLFGLRRMKAGTIQKAKPISEKFFPDSKVGWVRPAVKLGRTLIENYQIDAILSTSPPVSSHLIGMRLSGEFDLPWIADFRDYWSVQKLEDSYSDSETRERAFELMRQIQNARTASTAINNTIAQEIGGGEVVPNGFDPDLAALWTGDVGRKRIALGLLGHLHDAQPLVPLANVLERLKAIDPDSLDSLQLIQVGDSDEQRLHDYFRSRGLKVALQVCGKLPRTETIRRLNDASLFFLSLEDDAWVPSRVFELVASGRPILAHTGAKSEMARLIKEIGIGFSYQDDTVDAAAEWLKNYVRSIQAGSTEIVPRPEYSRSFSGKAMAETFAKILDRQT